MDTEKIMKWNKYPETKPEKEGEYIICSEDKKSRKRDYDIATYGKGRSRKKVYVEEYKGYIDVELEESMKFEYYDGEEVIAWATIPKYNDKNLDKVEH